jgi:glycolate oxidase iron-sulfur subunit
MVNKKINKPKQSIETKNLIEEATEIFQNCIKCGMCKSLCPVFKAMKEEEVSPRGHGILISEKKINELLFQCTLCKACEQKCPLNIKICDAIKKTRESMVLDDNGLKSNKQMIKNIQETGNPFGKDKPDKDKLYCC